LLYQIRRPCRQFPKLANGLCRHSDASVYLDRHLIRQATGHYVERCNALGLYRINAAFEGYQLLTARIAYNLSPLPATGSAAKLIRSPRWRAAAKESPGGGRGLE
jgi:hypothetical protein